MKSDHRQDLRFGALILSLSLHGLGGLGLLRGPTPEPSQSLAPVEIDLIEAPQTQEPRLLVMDTLEPEEAAPQPEDLTEAILKEARHLSRLTRRVKEELSAPLRPQGDGPSREVLPNFASEARFSIPVGEFIPGLQEGHFTALNTDQFLYYSFFKRINEQIRNRWIPRLRQATQGLPSEFGGSQRSQRLVSEIEVLLSPAGELEEITLLRSSGLRHVDLAAVHAIHNSAPFKNPPEEMIKEDGYIRLSYHFVLIFSPVFAAGP